MELTPIASEEMDKWIAFWNNVHGSDYPMREALFRQNTLEDPNWLPSASRAAFVDEELAGIVTVKYWQEGEAIPSYQQTGWIQWLAVAPKWRRQGIGSALLRHAEAELQKAGATSIAIGRDPGDFFPGVPSEYKETATWLEKHAYQSQGQAFDLAKVVPPITAENKPSVRPLKPEEAPALLAFLDREFPGRWAYEARRYFKAGGSGAAYLVLVENDDIVAFARTNQPATSIIGQNVYWAPLFDGPLGGIGPLGVAKSARGKGYGRQIIGEAVTYMEQLGLKHLVIDWTAHEGLYEKWGFVPYKHYEMYGKEL
ncbi:GNAT family N-acetyltransferase [Aureibacillus halotolerans]|uniref:GNAT family acetyltransferase n=1 Tax=Aureibacillus halotolerans TaxID=1508390 RepID=A0A4R6TZD0_9BACI|nr:GNAT family N-acetyltransferase [Aureibacillus halotolerans]TDQ38716.1 GNAT family acetyltransferase [Aureibacillus halotolerans]